MASTRAHALSSDDDSLIQDREKPTAALTRMRLALEVRSIHDGRRVVAGPALARLKASIVRLQAGLDRVTG
jgi:hypothetical protein